MKSAIDQPSLPALHEGRVELERSSVLQDEGDGFMLGSQPLQDRLRRRGVTFRGVLERRQPLLLEEVLGDLLVGVPVDSLLELIQLLLNVVQLFEERLLYLVQHGHVDVDATIFRVHIHVGSWDEDVLEQPPQTVVFPQLLLELEPKATGPVEVVGAVFGEFRELRCALLLLLRDVPVRRPEVYLSESLQALGPVLVKQVGCDHRVEVEPKVEPELNLEPQSIELEVVVNQLLPLERLGDATDHDLLSLTSLERALPV